MDLSKPNVTHCGLSATFFIFALVSLTICSFFAGTVYSYRYGCIKTGGEFITEMCVDKEYTNNVRFSFTGGATEVFWTFGFNSDSPRDTIRRIIDSIQ